MDRTFVENLFANASLLERELANKNELLEKNRSQIALSDGSIPERFQKAFSKLEASAESIKKQLLGTQEILLKVISFYIKENAMGNLLFDKNVEGTDYFEDLYSELLNENWEDISKAIDDYNLEVIDEITNKMRVKFVDTAFTAYIAYSKKLPINCA